MTKFGEMLFNSFFSRIENGNLSGELHHVLVHILSCAIARKTNYGSATFVAGALEEALEKEAALDDSCVTNKLYSSITRVLLEYYSSNT